MKLRSTLFCVLAFLMASLAWSKSFVHTVTSTNLVGGVTYLDDASVNNKGNVRPIVTQLYLSKYNNHKVGIYPEVNGAIIKWVVYNIDQSPLIAGVSFVIHVPDATDISYVYDYNAAASNVVSLSNTDLNSYLNSPVFLAEYTGNSNTVAVSSNSSNFRVVGTNSTNIPTSNTFHVFMHRGINSFTHKSGNGNISGNWTAIDHPALNNNPDALLTITQNGSTSFSKHVGVWYNGSKWTIFTQDISNLPENVAFNVYFENGLDFKGYDAIYHVTTAANNNTFVSAIDHPLLNNKPDANPIISPIYNPQKFPTSLTTSKTIGVYYQSSIGKWQLYTTDFSNMPENLVFNVLIPNPSTQTVIDSVTTAKKFGFAYNFSDALPWVKNSPHQPILYNQSWKSSSYDTAHSGLVYQAGAWLLRNGAGTDIPNTTRFHFLPVYGQRAFVLNKTTGIYIDHPAANNNPNAALFISPVYNASGVFTVQYYPWAFIAVYDQSSGKWWVNFQNAPSTVGVNVFVGTYTANTTGLEDAEANLKTLEIYPNPTKDFLWINSDFTKAEIIDLRGKIVRTYSNEGKRLDLNGIGAGMYTLRIHQGDKVLGRKVVVE